MKTELIYSNNKCSDIERALEEISRFRLHYRSLVDIKRGIFYSLRRSVISHRYPGLLETDESLQELVSQLEEIKNYVEASNVLQETYERYHGSLDIKVDSKHAKDKTPYYVLSIITDGYSDDIGSSGRVKIPGMRRSFNFSQEAMDRTFRRGVIDFSWLDGELCENGRRINDLCGDMNFFGSAAQKRLPLNEQSMQTAFENSGFNRHDILE